MKQFKLREKLFAQILREKQMEEVLNMKIAY